MNYVNRKPTHIQITEWSSSLKDPIMITLISSLLPVYPDFIFNSINKKESFQVFNTRWTPKRTHKKVDETKTTPLWCRGVCPLALDAPLSPYFRHGWLGWHYTLLHVNRINITFLPLRSDNLCRKDKGYYRTFRIRKDTKFLTPVAPPEEATRAHPLESRWGGGGSFCVEHRYNYYKGVRYNIFP